MLLLRRLSSVANKAKDFIQKTIADNDVVVFMKGTASQPLCGFSRNVCQLLEHEGWSCANWLLGLEKFTTVNVLEDESLRQGIKEFTEWPTIPQVFVKGKFIGGNDILVEMWKKGELRALLQKESLTKKE